MAALSGAVLKEKPMCSTQQNPNMIKKSYFSVLVAFLLGVTVATYAGQKKPSITSSLWQGATPEAAAANLLETARNYIDEDGSWENIQLGRVLYMSGEKERAEALFNRYRSGKLKADELVRIARVYAHAGDWDLARPLYDQVTDLAPKDADWLVEAGAFYNLNGDRETAERLFERGFDEEPKNLKNALTAAGSYLGVPPRVR